VQYAVQTCLSRPATADEVGRLVQLFERSRAKFQMQPEAARKLASEPLGSLPKDMDPAELASWTVVGNVLLNLDEALMKR
jgi:hypothetical protein